jgi:hypothetical protein
LEIPVRLVRQILDNLAVAGLVAETTKTVNHENTYQPSRAIEEITIQAVLDNYESAGMSVDVRAEDSEKIAQYLKQINQVVLNSSANVRIKDI